MMYTLREEIQIIVLLIIYGIYISLYYDLVNIFVKMIKNKIIKLLTEIILWLAQIYGSYLFTYQIQDGYIPIYFLLFILIGISLYFIFQKKTQLILEAIISRIIEETKKFIYPKYLKVVKSTFKKRNIAKRNKDIETWKG